MVYNNTISLIYISEFNMRLKHTGLATIIALILTGCGGGGGGSSQAEPAANPKPVVPVKDTPVNNPPVGSGSVNPPATSPTLPPIVGTVTPPESNPSNPPIQTKPVPSVPDDTSTAPVGNETPAPLTNSEKLLAESRDLCGEKATVGELLSLINTVRASGYQCGTTWYPAVKPVVWNNKIEAVALKYAISMSSNDFVEHTGLDGSSIGTRLNAGGYRFTASGENLAGGPKSIKLVHQAWLDSPGHCANVMSENFTEVALTCSANEKGKYKKYWVENFGSLD